MISRMSNLVQTNYTSEMHTMNMLVPVVSYDETVSEDEKCEMKHPLYLSPEMFANPQKLAGNFKVTKAGGGGQVGGTVGKT